MSFVHLMTAQRRARSLRRSLSIPFRPRLPCTLGHLPQRKVALFMERFAGRTDVYAHRWVSRKTGKPGWSPTTRYGADQRDPRPFDYLLFATAVVEQHLLGKDTEWHAGLYPMLENDHCRLLVCDFDDGEWRRDAAAYANACEKAGIEVLAEISRSGDGAHVWVFFEAAMPAAVARAAGATLLRRAMAFCPAMSFESYDRFFPSQDKLPTRSSGLARFGNLIALPLHGGCRRRGTAVFADPETWIPYEDQFAALSSVRLVRPEMLTEIAGTGSAASIGPPAALRQHPDELRSCMTSEMAKCRYSTPCTLVAAGSC